MRHYVHCPDCGTRMVREKLGKRMGDWGQKQINMEGFPSYNCPECGRVVTYNEHTKSIIPDTMVIYDSRDAYTTEEIRQNIRTARKIGMPLEWLSKLTRIPVEDLEQREKLYPYSP